jgi:hypothetical protein
MKAVASVLLLLLTLIASPAMAVEEPAFVRLSRDGRFEVRQYPALVVAEVTVEGDQSTAASRGFRLLAGYIFGGNDGGQKVAMTAPVLQSRSGGQKIAMTAPVTQSPSPEGWAVRFIMPRQYSLASLPAPNDPRVRLLPQPPERFAVIRFSGWVSDRDRVERTEELTAWMKSRRLKATGPAALAQYDPPWTLGFARRNEILIPIGEAPANN